MDGFEVDSTALRNMSGQLRQSTDGLDAAAKSEPPTAEATISNEAVGHTVSEILKATAAVIAGAQDVAGRINATDGGYGETDNRTAEDLHADVPKFSR